MGHELSMIEHSNTFRFKYRKRSESDKPWHEDYTQSIPWTTDPSLEEVIQDLEAYVNIRMRPVFDQDGEIIPEIQETWRPICDKDGNVLLDEEGRERGIRLGIVGPDYHILQDHEVINWFEPWVEAGLATIETAGAIMNHSRFWVLAKLKKDPVEVVKGDPVEQYLTCVNGHDGKLAFRGFPTDVRIVCANTVAIALMSDLAKRFRRRHHSNIKLKIEEVKEEIFRLQGIFDKDIEKFRHMAAHNVQSEEQVKTYFQKVLKKKVNPGEEIKDDGKRPLPTLMRLFNGDQPGSEIPAARDTWWHAYNAVTFMVTHLQSRNSDNRLDSMLNGLGAEMLQRAQDLAVQAADGKLTVN